MKKRILLGLVLIPIFALSQVVKMEFAPGWNRMTATEKSEVYLERYPGLIYYVVSTQEVYERCNKELQWNVTPAEVSPTGDKRVMWTLTAYTPFLGEQRDLLLKAKCELILLTDVETWKIKNGWSKPGERE